MSRPSKFTQPTADAICERIANGESLRAICADEGAPSQSMVYRWLDKHQEFREQYAHAREAQADKLVEEILTIADESDNDTLYTEHGEQANSEWIARSRLRVDARKWIASKMAPKKYGDKLALGGADDLPPIQTTSDAEAATKLAAIIAVGLARKANDAGDLV